MVDLLRTDNWNNMAEVFKGVRTSNCIIYSLLLCLQFVWVRHDVFVSRANVARLVIFIFVFTLFIWAWGDIVAAPGWG
ncbi:hypothetical protein V8C37DRAFT_394607 [Trichoderma ceciliae]